MRIQQKSQVCQCSYGHVYVSKFSETKLVNPLPPHHEIFSFREKISIIVDFKTLELVGVMQSLSLKPVNSHAVINFFKSGKSRRSSNDPASMESNTPHHGCGVLEPVSPQNISAHSYFSLPGLKSISAAFIFQPVLLPPVYTVTLNLAKPNFGRKKFPAKDDQAENSRK